MARCPVKALLGGVLGLVASTCAAAIEPAGPADGPDGPQWDLSGYAAGRALQTHERATSDDAVRGVATGLARVKVSSGDYTLQSQLRPRWGSSGEGHRLLLDELYLERKLSPLAYAYAGKKKLVYGVAIGRNPTDFFNLRKVQDRTLVDADRRAEVGGDPVMGIGYLRAGYTVNALIAKPAGEHGPVALLQFSGRLPGLAADYSVMAFQGDRPGVGLNVSSTLGDKVVVYGEAALRRGRDRLTPVVDANGTLAAAGVSDRAWRSDVVAGGQYTTEGGMTLTAEYWRNENGFSASEAAALARTADSRSAYAGLARSLLATGNLRVGSVFLRASELKLCEWCRGEISWVKSLDDHSDFLRGALNFEISDAGTLRLGVDYFRGARFTEYGINPVLRRIFIHYKYYL